MKAPIPPKAQPDLPTIDPRPSKVTHDTLFNALVNQDPARAAVVLREHLPPEIAEKLDSDFEPEREECSFVDGAGASSRGDALFKVRLKSGKPALVYCLLEHKSEPRGHTALQIAGYMISIWRREYDRAERGKGEKLPDIIPVVFYNGTAEWTAPMSVEEMVDFIDGSGNVLGYHLRNLGGMTPKELSSDPLVRSALLSMVVGGAKRRMRREEMRLTVEGLDGSQFSATVICHLVKYVSNMEELKPLLKEKQPENLENLMNFITRDWIEQGKAEGKLEGAANQLSKVLAHRFGALADSVERRISSASADEINDWAVAVLYAESLDDVFTHGASSA